MRMAPRGRVVKAEQQVGQRGFAGAAGADERDELAGFDFEIDVVQRDLLAVGKMDVLELDVRAGGVELSGVGGFHHGGWRVEQGENALAGGARLDDLILQLRQIFQAADT